MDISACVIERRETDTLLSWLLYLGVHLRDHASTEAAASLPLRSRRWPLWGELDPGLLCSRFPILVSTDPDFVLGSMSLANLLVVLVPKCDSVEVNRREITVCIQWSKLLLPLHTLRETGLCPF